MSRATSQVVVCFLPALGAQPVVYATVYDEEDARRTVAMCMERHPDAVEVFTAPAKQVPYPSVEEPGL